jgi:hypothetical protein
MKIGTKFYKQVIFVDKREFINPLKFPEWLKEKIDEYTNWFNHSRFHRGVKAFPADLYECNVGKLT